MAKAKIHELEEKIESQGKIILKYEIKLRDVVSAYKSLQKEKNVLEETIKSLSCSDAKTSKENRFESTPQFDDPLRSNSTVDTSLKWQEKLNSVTKALTTITDEKSKMEANFQADKKKINQEKDELKRQINFLKENENQTLKNIDKYKQRLRNLQMEREKEQNDHQIMLRELQEIVSVERLEKDELQLQLEEAQMAIAIKESQSDKSKQYEKRIKNLMEELKSLKSKLKIAEETATKPSSMELKLQYEMARAEGEHRLEIFQEQQRSKQVEENLKQEMKTSSEQINGLETKLADLSEMIGEYERQKQHDFIVVQKLKEKNNQLEIENCALAKAANCINEKETDESKMDAQRIKIKIGKLMEILKNQYDYNDSNRFEMDHGNCQLKYDRLKNEFELYKRRNQTTLDEKFKDNFKEDELRHQIAELKEKITNLSLDLEETEKKHGITIASLRNSLDECDFNQKQQVEYIKNEYRSKLNSLEQQLQRQRERSFALIEEKENEMELLKIQLGIGRRKSSKQIDDTFFDEKSNFADSNVNLLGVAVELCKLSTSDKKEAQFIHYAQEIARKDVEISNLRKSKHGLETTLRELEIKNSAKHENLVGQIQDANEEIGRLRRYYSREGANLEYLKNVVLSYMISSSSTSRQHMLNAIATVLKFSSKELESVKIYNSTWW